MRRNMLKMLWLCSLMLALLLSACGQSARSEELEQHDLSQTTWQEQYDLGVRYLNAGSYEEAIIAFTAAIEIDPKQAPAYVGRADSYMAVVQKNESADQVAEFYQKALLDYETAAGLGDTSAEEKAQNVRMLLERLAADSEADTLLAALYALFAQDDVEGAKALMRMDEYIMLSENAPAGGITYQEDQVLAVYPNNFYYFGQWTDGQRSGSGLWLRAVYDADSSTESYTYRGMWVNDLPNGSGTIVRIQDASKVQVEEGHTTSIRTEITGTFQDGLYHGTIHEVWHMNDGGVHDWSPIAVVSGIYQPMDNIPPEIAQRPYSQQSLAEGRYLVAIDNNNPSTDLWDSGSVHSVSGVLG